ncbi:hypothetical protein LP419_25360 [Massilia sp. H-1]|nr:hypothetical protein LP419_25360 [Massilia sp. H-1]
MRQAFSFAARDRTSCGKIPTLYAHARRSAKIIFARSRDAVERIGRHAGTPIRVSIFVPDRVHARSALRDPDDDRAANFRRLPDPPRGPSDLAFQRSRRRFLYPRMRA